MKITKCKIVKSIYNKQITSFHEFLEKYIADHKFFPEGHDKTYWDQSYKTTIKSYYAGNKKEVQKLVKLYNDTIKTLEKLDCIRYQSKEYDSKIHFLVDAPNNEYSGYDPYFYYPETIKRELVPNKAELKKYIRRGCRTKQEHSALIWKRFIFSVKYILPIIGFIILVFNFLFNIFGTSEITKDEREKPNLETKDSPIDTLAKKDSSKLEQKDPNGQQTDP